MRRTVMMMALALVACGGDKATRKPALMREVVNKALDVASMTTEALSSFKGPKEVLTVPADKSEVLIGPGVDPAGASQYFGTEDRSRFGVECLNKNKGFHCTLEFPESYRKRKEYFCFAAWVKCAKGITTQMLKVSACYRFDKYRGPVWFGPKALQCDRISTTALALVDLRKKPWTKKDWDDGSEPGTIELKIR